MCRCRDKTTTRQDFSAQFFKSFVIDYMLDWQIGLRPSKREKGRISLIFQKINSEKMKVVKNEKTCWMSTNV